MSVLHKEQKSKELKSLQTTHPELAKQWHPTKNGGLTPTDVMANSNKKVWWIFPYDDPNSGRHFDFEWQTTVYKRAICGTKCPYLINQAILPGFNDLYTTNPALAKEWHPVKNKNLTPFAVVGGSSKKVWWKCDHGHEWEATINSRNKGVGCPYCMGKKAITGHNDLQTVNPELAKEWNYEKNNGLTPTQVLPNSNKKVWWKCVHGHEWQANINSRTKGNNCPFCASQRVVVGYNDLRTINPSLAEEWNYELNGELRPENFAAYSSKKVWWKCSKGHEWQATINNRTQGRGCPYCASKKVLKGFNDLQTLNPILAREWNDKRNGKLTPADVTPHSNKKVWWICSQGHEWQAIINSRTRGSGCPVCHKGSVTSFPETIVYFYVKQKYADAIQSYKPHWLKSMEIDIFIPSLNLGIEYDGARWHRDVERDNKKNTICETHNINLIRIRELGCPNIDGQNIVINSNSEAELEKAIVFLFQRYLQSDVDINIQRDIVKIRNIVQYHKQDNSLLKCNPSLALEWHPIKNGKLMPEHVGPSSNKKVWWKCNKGHEWQATINSRNSGSGCPYCSGRRAVKGENDLATINPALAKEWNYEKNHGLLPSDVLSYSDKKVWWKCNEGHEWQATIASRSQGCGCPVCAGKSVQVGFNDLKTLNPVISTEWHPIKNKELTPNDFTDKSRQIVWWKCSVCQHEWQAAICNRTRGTGCPVCARNTRGQTQKRHMKEKRLGEVNTMKSGMQCKIINYINSANVVVEFENKVTKRATYSNFKKGAVSHL